MNKIKKFFLIKKKEKEYRQYIWNHKKNVIKAFFEMLQCKDLDFIMQDTLLISKLWIKILEHDDSKYDKEEFDAYRKHFYPIDDNEKINNKDDYQKAWEHHYKNNNHHWQHRQDWPNIELDIDTKIACLENLADWLAMGYQFHDRPYEYYEKNKNKIFLPQKQKEFLEKCIYEGIDKKWCKEGNKNV